MDFVACPVCSKQCEATDQWCSRCRTELHLVTEDSRGGGAMMIQGVAGRLVAIALLYGLGVFVALKVTQ
jgi:predicted nucleic acid-binding Zn ribbon protein